jgi:hypothetical protein
VTSASDPLAFSRVPERPGAAERRAVRAWVELIAGRARTGELLELRRRLPDGGMAKRFFPAHRPAGLTEAVVRLGQAADVYVGCALRGRRSGRREGISCGWVAWADCDSAESVRRLTDFAAPPSMVVRSGAAGGRHAYWALREPAAPRELEAVNRRLAAALEADDACWDATRILRPPATTNHKYRPPAPVVLELYAAHRRYALAELLDELPVLAPEPPRQRLTPGPERHNDPLRAVPPARYVSALLGVDVPRHRKVPCPFHADEDPSLHVYPRPGQGWFCFSCRRGGSAYDLAAGLWGVGTRGASFIALRERLAAELGIQLDRAAEGLDR